jgi:hypothetical protein
VNMPGFTAESSLEKTRGHYHGSAHAFTEAGGNALLPAQVWSGWCPDPWSESCLWSCRRHCSSLCARWDRSCLLSCNEDCYWQCNCITP